MIYNALYFFLHFFIIISFFFFFILWYLIFLDPVDQERTFTLELAEVCTRDEKVYNLLMDLEVLHDMAKKLPEDHKGFEALYAGNQIINHIVKNEMRWDHMQISGVHIGNSIIIVKWQRVQYPFYESE